LLLLLLALGAAGGLVVSDALRKEPTPEPIPEASPANAPPRVGDLHLRLVEGEGPIEAAFPTRDDEGDRLEHRLLGRAKRGRVALLDAERGRFRYAPRRGEVGADQFDYEVVEREGGRASRGTVRVTIVARGPIELRAPAPKIRFGSDVAIEGDLALIGANLADEKIGSVSVARRNPGGGWDVVQELSLLDHGGESFEFGFALAMRGRRAVVGAWGGDWHFKGPPGEAYVYSCREAGLRLEARLTAPIPLVGDVFGFAVAVSGDAVLIGARGRSKFGKAAGAAYLYRRSPEGEWELEASLYPPDPDPGDEFGFAVALEGDTAVVSANLDDEAGRDAGAVYFFAREAGLWSFREKFLPDPGFVLTGGEVVLERGIALVNTVRNRGGVAYCFVREGETWRRELIRPPLGTDPVRFGCRVALGGETAAISARDGDDHGHVYFYRRRDGGWHHVLTVEDPCTSPDIFGWTVDLDGTSAIVGAIHAREMDGTVYFYGIPR
jgi:hypothetical protein